jgi:hypothetical protein
VLLVSLLLAGCEGSHCLELETDCAPQYEPTFDQVWANTLSPSCALSGCHGGGTASGGLELGADADTAHAALVDAGHVEPGDPGCSHLMAHLELDGGAEPMPPGAPLDEAELCAIRQWIADGAAR